MNIKHVNGIYLNGTTLPNDQGRMVTEVDKANQASLMLFSIYLFSTTTMDNVDISIFLVLSRAE